MSESEHTGELGGEALSAALALQRRLTQAVSAGVGLAGLASVLAELVGRPAVIWAGSSVAVVVSSPDVRPPTRPTPNTTPSWSVEAAFVHEDWLWRVAQPGDSRSLVVVGVASVDASAGEDERLALEETAAIAALEVYRLQSVAAAELRVWGELADEIVDDHNRARVRAHADALGFDHSVQRRVTVVTSTDVDASVLLAKVSAGVGRVGGDVLVTVRGDRVVMIVSEDFDRRAMLRGLRDALVGKRFSIGVSACHDVVSEYQQAVQEAEVAAALGATMRGDGITHYEDLGVYRLLAANGDTTELDRFVQRWLGAVIEYDEAHDSELVRSLAEYLERGGSLDQAAESLFIHRSTLKYRLGRVANLAGVDLTDPDTRFNLQLATRVLATVLALASVSSR
jgi:hypothetical protein